MKSFTEVRILFVYCFCQVNLTFSLLKNIEANLTSVSMLFTDFNKEIQLK